jgi:uroporphyrinogen decarboxylase
MTSRERVLTALRHEEPDRVPCNIRLAYELTPTVEAALGHTDYAEHFGHDVRAVYIPLAPLPEGVADIDWTPRPAAEDIAAAREQVEALHARGLAVCGGYACGVFEQAKAWLGDVGALTGPYDDPRAFGELLDRITAWKADVYAGYAEAGCDIVWMGDDLGTQRSLVMREEQYREWYRPRHAMLAEHLHRKGREARIAFHCCGHVTPLVGDLIDIGIDILEAVQAETMDIAYLKREFGRDISFWGAVGAQSVLARTTPEEVREGVRATLAIMAPGGGYIAAPCHTLTEEVPWTSIVALHEAVAAYGRYPISA